jgi:hypothetical protein
VGINALLADSRESISSSLHQRIFNLGFAFRSDKFFDLENSTLKILWPISLQDCFTQDPSTGLFKITASFDKRIYDIDAWTFGPEMFESFPDLYGVAPAFNSIPGKVDEVRKRTWWVMSDDERTDEVGDGKENQIVRRRKGDGLGIDVRGLKWHKFNDRGKEVTYFTFW